MALLRVWRVTRVKPHRLLLHLGPYLLGLALAALLLFPLFVSRRAGGVGASPTPRPLNLQHPAIAALDQSEPAATYQLSFWKTTREQHPSVWQAALRICCPDGPTQPNALPCPAEPAPRPNCLPIALLANIDALAQDIQDRQTDVESHAAAVPNLPHNVAER